MKYVKIVATAFLLAGAVGGTAHAQQAQIRGSDTLFGAITEAIRQAGLTTQLQYTGGGSGLGETALVNGSQNIAPMSRALNPAAIDALLNQGATPVQSVIGLDGVSLYVRASETVQNISIPTIRGIYQCTITNWSQVPGSGKSGVIAAFRRNDDSGTTDVFRTLIGITAFGSCVTALATTEDIADVTSTNTNAIGYSGLSGLRPGQNKALSVATSESGPFVAPTTTTIRNFSYPLARRLFVNSVTDGRVPTADEQELLDSLLDRSFLDPILEANEFITCPSSGCP